MIPLAALPTLNAALNATSATLLVAGVVAVRRSRIRWHIACMIGATLVSSAFLVSYLTYHAHVGSVHFTGQGWVRALYFAILITHTILAAVIVPMILRTLYLAGMRRFDAHRRLARVTAPLWLYVSITGVVIYAMLYHRT